MRGKYKNGATYFEAYITIHCVVVGIRLVLAVLPMHAGDTVAEFMPKIMKLCMNVPKISLVMMDREFCTQNKPGHDGQGILFGRDDQLSQ